jgi:hypothetical protein
VVAFNVPDRWKRSEYDSLEGRSSLCLDEYENGIPGGYQYFSFLEWLKLNEGDSPSDGHTPSDENTLDTQGHVLPLKTEATVSPTQVTVAYSFHNKSDGITDYKLTIRRSTRRFIETWDAGGDTTTETGHCTVLEEPDKETKK